MRNNIMVFGNSLFISTKVENFVFSVNSNKITSRLYDKFNVDNFSNCGLCVKESIKYIEEFSKIRNYDYCIINLGEADYFKKSVSDFKTELLEMIDLLNKKSILPILVSLSNKFIKKEKAYEFQEAIDDIAQNNKIHYVYSGNLDLNNTIKVKNDSQIKRALVELCM